MTHQPLRITPATPDTATILRDAIEGRDEAARALARFDQIIADQGARLWQERNPGQRLFLRLTLPQIRAMVRAEERAA